MNEGSKEPGAEGEPPEPSPAGSSSEPRGGGSVCRWILSAHLLALLAMGLAVAALVLHFVDEDEEAGQAVTAQPTATAQVTPAQPTPTPPAVVQVSVDDDPSWGPDDAPVTIIEFSDYL